MVMKVFKAHSDRLLVGEGSIHDCISPGDPRFGVVFEDDGDTGYLYAMWNTPKGDLGGILDALHIYDVDKVIDRDVEGTIDIAWSDDGTCAFLFISNTLHAFIDFHGKIAMCRTGFPPASVGGDFAATHEWDNAHLARFE